MADKRPNIIIFNPDEMRWDTMGHMGNPAAVTPFLDEFARTEGVSFNQAFCQNTVCVPSRCSFFTGLYPHVNGHRTMSYLLRPGEESLFSELKRAGYYVWMNGRNDLLAGEYPGLVESHADEIFYNKPIPGGKVCEENDFPFYSHFGGKLDKAAGGDDQSVAAAINRIKNPMDDRPLCIFLGMGYPHCPYQVEEPFYSGIDRNKLPPRVRPEETEGKAYMIEKLREMAKLDDMTDEHWDELRAVYLGMCSKIDYNFRQLCEALKEAGEYDNSAIFFLSDHGDFAGDHSLPEKAQNVFDDCLTRVPFLVKPPKGEAIDPGVSDALVELVDFYATAMDYAGVKPCHDHFGRSLRPALADRSAPFRRYAFCEGGRMPYEIQCDEYDSTEVMNHVAKVNPNTPYWPKKLAQRDPVAHAKGTMIRDNHYKYVHRTIGSCEFYDLQADPGERRNVIDDPQYAPVIAQMKAALLDWYQETCDIVPYDYDSRQSMEQRWRQYLRTNTLPEGHEEELEKIFKFVSRAAFDARLADLQK